MGEKKYPLVEVTWEDAWSTGMQCKPDDSFLRTPALTKSVGYLLERRPRIILVQSLAQTSDRIHDTLTLPPHTERKVTYLTQTKRGGRRKKEADKDV